MDEWMDDVFIIFSFIYLFIFLIISRSVTPRLVHFYRPQNFTDRIKFINYHK